jgi:hypothetical protein
MEYFSLGDLSHHIQNITSPVLEHEAIQILSQILEGVDFMHRMKYAHRDLKPAVRSLHAANDDQLMTIAIIEHLGCKVAARLVGQDCRLWHQQVRDG